MLLGWLIYRRGFTRWQVAGMALSYGGVLLVFGHEVRLVGPNVAWGAFLVFLSTLSYAVYLVYSGQLVQRLGSLRLVGLATSVACLCCMAQFAVLRPLHSVLALAPQVLWLSVLNATLCTAVPVLLVMMAIERIGSDHGRADRHGRAAGHHLHGRADPGRAVHRLDCGRHGAGAGGIFAFGPLGPLSRGGTFDIVAHSLGGRHHGSRNCRQMGAGVRREQGAGLGLRRRRWRAKACTS
jgi:hypothetical protein